MSEIKKRGEIIEDPDGSKWYVIGHSTLNGKLQYNRVRVGSIAARVLGLEKSETEETDITK
jgi:hypothetical protein